MQSVASRLMSADVNIGELRGKASSFTRVYELYNTLSRLYYELTL